MVHSEIRYLQQLWHETRKSLFFKFSKNASVPPKKSFPLKQRQVTLFGVGG